MSTHSDRTRRRYLPSPHSLFLRKIGVEFFAGDMCTFRDDQSPIFRSIRKEVDQSLQTSQARPVRILILMRPRYVRTDILAAMYLCISQDGENRMNMASVTHFGNVQLNASKLQMRSSVPHTFSNTSIIPGSCRSCQMKSSCEIP